jgi:ketosteroid isomerase-like protein
MSRTAHSTPPVCLALILVVVSLAAASLGHTDDFHGTEVADPNRRLEDVDSAETRDRIARRKYADRLTGIRDDPKGGLMTDTTGHEQELMDADRRFAGEVAAAAPEDRGAVWAGWFAPDGRQIIPGRVVQGTRSIAELMGPAFATVGYSLTWAPDLASASADGDMGWTSGRYESRSTGPEGEKVGHGRYLTIWRRQADGGWKVALDNGVPDPGD